MRRMFCFLRSTPKSRFNEWALSDLFSSLNRIEFTIVKYVVQGRWHLFTISLNRDLSVHHRASIFTFFFVSSSLVCNLFFKHSN